jgi:hypothetical protein
LNAPHSKCGIRATVSGVRIPPSPPPFAPSGLRVVLPRLGINQNKKPGVAAGLQSKFDFV